MGFPSTYARGNGSFREWSLLVTLFFFGTRNESLVKAGLKFPTPIKTGTTIAGIVFKVRCNDLCGNSCETKGALRMG